MEPITEKVLSALPNLKIIGKMASAATRSISTRCANTRFASLHARHEQARCGRADAVLHDRGAAWVTPLNMAMRNGERPA